MTDAHDASPWPCLVDARRCWTPRVDFLVADGPHDTAPRRVGSVALVHVPLLAAWPADLRLGPQAVTLTTAATQRDAALAQIHAALRSAGAIRAWRDEAFPLLGPTGETLAVIERAAARFWGALTLGAHCNGYVADAHGRPTHLWIARRSLSKPTDPGRLDNLIGGGVPMGQTPRQALLREAWEEAGLRPGQMAGLQPGGVIELDCDVPEGRQREWLHVYDLALPAGLTPCNQDGEVAEHRCLPLDQALAHAASGEMTTDAALATLDFALRHRLLGPLAEIALTDAWRGLQVQATQAGRFDDPTPAGPFNSTEVSPQSG